MTIPRRQKTACIHTLSAALAVCLLPMGAAQAELFVPHYRSWGWDDYRPHYRSWGWDDYEPYRQRRHRAHKGHELEQKAKPQEVAKGPLCGRFSFMQPTSRKARWRSPLITPEVCSP
jgi:hypothetical protein